MLQIPIEKQEKIINDIMKNEMKRIPNEYVAHDFYKNHRDKYLQDNLEEVNKSVEWLPLDKHLQHINECKSCPHCKIWCKKCQYPVHVFMMENHELIVCK